MRRKYLDTLSCRANKIAAQFLHFSRLLGPWFGTGRTETVLPPQLGGGNVKKEGKLDMRQGKEFRG